MTKPTKLETREDFIRYMAKDAAKPAGVRNRFQLDKYRGWGSNEQAPLWLLKIAGTGGKYHSHQRITIPTEIGEILAEDWPTTKWNRFRGVRGAARLLEDIGAADSDILDEVEAEMEAREEREQERRRMNLRDSLRRVTGQLNSIGKDATDKLAGALDREALTDEQAELAQTALDALIALGESLGDEAET